MCALFSLEILQAGAVKGLNSPVFKFRNVCGKIRKGSNCKATSFVRMLTASFFVPRTNCSANFGILFLKLSALSSLRLFRGPV